MRNFETLRSKPYWFEVAALAQFLRAFCSQFFLHSRCPFARPSSAKRSSDDQTVALDWGRVQQNTAQKDAQKPVGEPGTEKANEDTQKNIENEQCSGLHTDVWGDMTGPACCLRKEGETEHQPRSKETLLLRRRELSPGLPRDRRKY